VRILAWGTRSSTNEPKNIVTSEWKGEMGKKKFKCGQTKRGLRQSRGRFWIILERPSRAIYVEYDKGRGGKSQRCKKCHPPQRAKVQKTTKGKKRISSAFQGLGSAVPREKKEGGGNFKNVKAGTPSRGA